MQRRFEPPLGAARFVSQRRAQLEETEIFRALALFHRADVLIDE